MILQKRPKKQRYTLFIGQIACYNYIQNKSSESGDENV